MYSIAVREALARVNTFLIDRDLEPVMLPSTKQCRTCGKPIADRTNFCPPVKRVNAKSKTVSVHMCRNQYRWPVWGSEGCDAAFSEFERLAPTRCTRTEPTDWEPSFDPFAHFTPEGDEEEVQFAGSAPSHDNDRWPDYPVCSKCQHIPNSQALRIHFAPRSPVRSDGPWNGIGKRAARFIQRPPSKPRRRLHASAKHAGVVPEPNSTEGFIQYPERFGERREAVLSIEGLRPVSYDDYAGDSEVGDWETPDRRNVFHLRPLSDEEEALAVGMKPFLDRLTDGQREALNLVYVERMSFREASAELGLKSAAAQARINRAKAVLRKAFTEEIPPADIPARLKGDPEERHAQVWIGHKGSQFTGQGDGAFWTILPAAQSAGRGPAESPEKEGTRWTPEQWDAYHKAWDAFLDARESGDMTLSRPDRRRWEQDDETPKG
jgi:hypothetical protein